MRISIRFSVSTGLVSLLACSGLMAQESSQTSTTASGADSTGLQEIIVTAERRAETVNTVPISIAAFSGETLQAQGITDIVSLARITPAMSVGNSDGYNLTFIRGVGNGIYVGADPSIATFIDDTPRIYGSAVNNLVNVARVEILKGAQGGLYGRNATGGVINIITRQPSNDFSAQINASAGSKETIDVEGFVNIPLNDAIAMNLSVVRQYHHPYIVSLAGVNPYPAGTQILGVDANSVVHPTDTNDQDFSAVDGKLRFQLTEALKITLSADSAWKRDRNGAGWFQNDPATTYQTYAATAAGFGATPLPGPFPGLARPFTNFNVTPEYVDTTDYGTAAKIEYSLPGIDLLSISSYRWNNTGLLTDVTATIVPVVSSNVFNERHNFYQEFRVLSNGSGPFQYIAGATYLKDKQQSTDTNVFLGVYPTTPSEAETRSTNWSVYGQGSYDFTSAFSLTASLRYIKETKTVSFPLYEDEGHLSNDKLLPSATLNYKLDGGTLYARYAKGFKTGGINPIVPIKFFPTPLGSTFAPEQVDTYEIGYKAPFLERRMQLTSAIFYNNYKDIQIDGNSTDPNLATIIVNAQRARTYGAEMGLSWRVVNPLTLSGGVGYLNARYVNYDFAGVGVVAPAHFNGKQMPYAPKIQANISAELDKPIRDGLRLIGNVVTTFNSREYYDASDIAVGSQGAYSLTNIRLGVATADDHFRFYVYANNLFDRFYTSYGSGVSPVGYMLSPGDPRIFGGTLEVRY